MCQNEYGYVIGRVLTPPPHPIQIRPVPTNRPEHVPPDNPRADVVFEVPCRKVVVESGGAIAPAMHPLERARRDKPFVQLFPTHTERIVEVLIRPGSVSVKRYGKALNSNPCHLLPFKMQFFLL